MLCSPVTHHLQWVQEVLPHVSHQLRLFSVLCWLASLCARGGRAQHCIEATWRSVGDDGGRRGGGEGACLKWVVSFRLTAELAVCREEREQSSPDNDNTLYICRPGQCQRRNCGGSDGNRTSIYRDSFDFNKTVELTA